MFNSPLMMANESLLHFVMHIIFRPSEKNLFSKGVAEDAGWRRDGSKVGIARYYHPKKARSFSAHRIPRGSQQTIEYWHKCLNHMSLQKMKRIQENNIVPNMAIPLSEFNKPYNCITCNESKMTQIPLTRPNNEDKTKNLLPIESISVDVFGPVNP